MLQIFINFHWTGFELLNSPFVATWSRQRELQKQEEDYGHLFQFMIIAQNIIGFNIEPFKFQAEAHLLSLMFITFAIHFFPSIINFMLCQKSILNSVCILIRQANKEQSSMSMSECYAAPKQMEKTTKSITKLPYFVMAGIPNHNLHHPITPITRRCLKIVGTFPLNPWV